MTPTQAIVRSEMEGRPRTGGKSVKGWGINGDVSLRCVSNCEDTAFHMESLAEQKVKEFREEENVELDIVGCSDGDGNDDADETDDGTEYSSSFGNTCSGNEDGSRFSDSEVDSLHGDSSLFDGLDNMFRMGRKKVTTQWKQYISPLTWRGKWIELKIRAMKSQLSKYERELASYDQKQPLDFSQGTSEGVKSLPFSGQNHNKAIMKRRKRKRLEDMVDVPSYMSQHKLFSYFENKKSDAEGPSVDDDPGIQAITADDNTTEEFDINFACPALESGDDNSLEHVLWKIEAVQSRVQKLKSQMEKLLKENAGKFSSVESLTELAESDLPTSSPTSPDLSPGNVERLPTGATYSPPRHMADYHEPVSSYGEGAPDPEIIECSIAPLSEEVRLDQSYFVDSYPNNGNDTVMHEEVKREPHEFERVSAPPPVAKPQELVKVKEENVGEPSSSVVSPKLEPSQKANATEENSDLKSSLPTELHGPSTKRKRGERKAGTGTWAADKIVTQILS